MSTSLRVLFVEDSLDDVALLSATLEAAGYVLESARVETDDDLRAALASREWDIVLCDYMMPRFDAQAAIRVVREVAPRLPLIVISGTVGEEIAVETLKLGADDYLLKGNLLRFVPAVERALEFATDRHQRALAEERLRESEAMMAAAQGIARFGSWVLQLAPDGRTPAALQWSDECFRVFGYEPRSVEVTLDHALARVHPEDRAGLREAMRETVENRLPFSLVHRVVLPGGEERHLHQQACVTVDDRTGRPLRLVGTAHDITETFLARTRLEQALEREKELARQAQAGERAKSEFLAVMSHEIRTPMNAMLGFAELLASTPGLPPECRGFVRTINSSGVALLRIVDDILEFSRLEAGRMPVERSAFSPRALLVEVQSLLRPLAQDKGLELGFDISPSVPATLESDPGRLQQVLVNLVNNAIKFTARGSIVLGLRVGAPSEGESGETVEVFVRDTGPGIPADKVGQIFGAFIQADSSLRRRYAGTGLGLAISRRLVELMGGELAVRSEEGVGSEFIVRLPLRATASAPTPPGEGAIPEDPLADAGFAARHPLRILAVDDDPLNLKLIVDVTQRLGYEPRSARDGREALARCQEEMPDVILMDVHMPEMDGVEAMERIRALERHAGDRRARVIAVTANVYARERCLAAGADGFLSKPVRIEVLKGLLAGTR